jgi:hypothetical protein
VEGGQNSRTVIAVGGRSTIEAKPGGRGTHVLAHLLRSTAYKQSGRLQRIVQD